MKIVIVTGMSGAGKELHLKYWKMPDIIALTIFLWNLF